MAASVSPVLLGCVHEQDGNGITCSLYHAPKDTSPSTWQEITRLQSRYTLPSQSSRHSIAFRSDNRQLAFCCSPQSSSGVQGRVVVLSLETYSIAGWLVTDSSMPVHAMTAVSFTRRGKSIWTISLQGHVYCANLTENNTQHSSPAIWQLQKTFALPAHDQSVSVCLVSRDDQVAVARGRQLVLFDTSVAASHYAPKRVISDRFQDIVSLSFAPFRPHQLLVAHNVRQLSIYDTLKDSIISQLDAGTSTALAVAVYSPFNKYVAMTADTDGWLRVLDVETKAIVKAVSLTNQTALAASQILLATRGDGVAVTSAVGNELSCFELRGGLLGSLSLARMHALSLTNRLSSNETVPLNLPVGSVHLDLDAEWQKVSVPLPTAASSTVSSLFSPVLPRQAASSHSVSNAVRQPDVMQLFSPMSTISSQPAPERPAPRVWTDLAANPISEPADQDLLSALQSPPKKKEAWANASQPSVSSSVQSPVKSPIKSPTSNSPIVSLRPKSPINAPKSPILTNQQPISHFSEQLQQPKSPVQQPKSPIQQPKSPIQQPKSPIQSKQQILPTSPIPIQTSSKFPNQSISHPKSPTQSISHPKSPTQAISRPKSPIQTIQESSFLVQQAASVPPGESLQSPNSSVTSSTPKALQSPIEDPTPRASLASPNVEPTPRAASVAPSVMNTNSSLNEMATSLVPMLTQALQLSMDEMTLQLRRDIQNLHIDMVRLSHQHAESLQSLHHVTQENQHLWRELQRMKAEVRQWRLRAGASVEESSEEESLAATVPKYKFSSVYGTPM